MRKASADQIKQWNEFIKLQGESSLSDGEFCQSNNLNIHAFRYWKRKAKTLLSKESKTMPKSKSRRQSSSFLPVTVVSDKPSSSRVSSWQLPSGNEVPKNRSKLPDPQWVAKIIGLVFMECSQ